MIVALELGTSTLLARVTTRSAQALGLTPGLAVFAQIKGVAVLG
jgi:molybdate transport system ATP-binding protein